MRNHCLATGRTLYQPPPSNDPWPDTPFHWRYPRAYRFWLSWRYEIAMCAASSGVTLLLVGIFEWASRG